jgi:hypothetical protein
MVTQNGATDVLSVRTIKVSNGTLTDEGDGVVSLDTAGAESIDELTDVTITSLTPSQFLQYNGISGFWENKTIYLATLADTKGTPTEGKFLKYTGGFWQPADGSANSLNDLSDVTITTPITGNILQYSANWGWYNTNLPTPSPPPSTTDALPEGTVNLYYTEARVSANTDVAANTAKVGITAQQAADILNNNAKVSLIAGGTTGQALVKSTGTDYDVEWADISIDVQYHNRFQTDAETFRSGATETVELYYTAKADGDGLAESASSDTPAAGYDIRRKLYYSEAGFADPDTGTWTQFTAIADNTTFNNAKAALLAYLKERTGGTVPISLKMTWEEVAQAPSFTGLLNESYGSGAEAAYSTRRLNGNVTECMVIRRASDSTTTTIGFDGSGNIDEAAINTFCTGTTCTVVTWKDQSGNGNDATAAASTNEPTIYTGGALVKENGRVAVDFDGSDFLDAGSGFNLSTLSMITIQKSFDDGGTDAYAPISLVAGATQGLRQQIKRSSPTALRSRFDSTNLDLNTSNIYNQVIISSLYDGAIAYSYFNGGNVQSSSLTLSSLSSNSLRIGDAGSNGLPYKGKFQEAFLFDSSKSTSDRTSIEENIGDYFTQNTPLLDTYSGAAAAYSLRLLDSSYVGSAVEVYNGSSYADIGFNVFGELDTVALAAHCGSNDGFVSVWYDQSGNGNHAVQTTTAIQAKIFDATANQVITNNGKPAIQPTNPPGYATGVSGLTDATIIGVGNNALAPNSQPTIVPRIVSSYGGSGSIAANQLIFRYRSDTDVYDLATSGGTISVAADGQPDNFIATFKKDGSTGYIGFNGSSYASGTIGSITNELYLFEDAGGSNRELMTAHHEIIIYDSAQSDANRSGIEDNINTFYNIY